jgi:hypothetical protein
MGVIKHFSSSSFDNNGSSYNEPEIIKVESSPDPTKFKLVNMKYIGAYMILKIQYEDANNYEGLKILVFKDIKYNDLLVKNKNTIDPHFAENKEFVSPIARFEPTTLGWENAIRFCEAI